MSYWGTDYTDREMVEKAQRALRRGQYVHRSAQRAFEYATPNRHSHVAVPGWPAYEKPNGGKRMLNSAYTRLKDWWVRNDGTPKRPRDMNDGHLENTLKLLKESHGNAIARATAILGKLEAHFGNRPDVVEKLADLCRTVQTIEVDEMYPIWKHLSEELQSRERPPYEIQFWGVDPHGFDEDFYHGYKPY